MIETIPDDELNVGVSEKVMGVRVDPDDCGCTDCALGKTANCLTIPNYCTDIAAAMLVLSHFKDKGIGFRLQLSIDCTQWEVYNHDDGIFLSGWSWVKGHDYIFVNADTLPRAICLAALEAVELLEAE